MKPVYIINGFLDSGKTEFMAYTMDQDYFHIRGRTLLILCEEGEIEYDTDLLRSTNTTLELIEDEKDFTPARLSALEKRVRPERIIIEYNGMWNFKNLRLPMNWRIEQQLTIIDGSTFVTYYTNMKSLLAEMLRNSDMILFNRCDGIDNLNVYKRNVKAINQRAQIIFEGSEGEINSTFEEDLPYSLNDDPIDLKPEDYGIWYIDALDNLDRYDGKRVRFTAMAMHPRGFPKSRFVPGRLAMTCCSADMTFLGYICEYPDASSFRDKDWIKVTARVKREYNAAYNGEGAVLYAESVEKTSPLKDKIVTFS